MLKREDFMPIPYLKKAKFTGSYQGMRYRMEKVEKEERETVLRVGAWPEPYSYDATPKEQVISQDFEFSENGIQEGIAWLNETYGKF